MAPSRPIRIMHSVSRRLMQHWLLLLVLFTLAVAALWAVFITYMQNELSADLRRQSKNMLSLSLEADAKALANLCHDNAYWNEAYRKVAMEHDLTWARDTYHDLGRDTHQVRQRAVIDQHNAIFFSAPEVMGAGSTLEVLFDEGMGALLQQTRSLAPNQPGVRAYLSRHRQLYLVSACLIEPDTQSLQLTPSQRQNLPVLVLARPLNDERLQQLALQLKLPDLRVQWGLPAERNTDSYLPLWAGDGHPTATLEWNVEPYRIEAAWRLLMLSLLALAVFCAILVLLAHRASRRLDHLLLHGETQEARFHDVAELAYDLVWETDAQHRLSYLSRRFSRVLGMPVEPLLGKYLLDLVPSTARSRYPRWVQELEAILQRREDFKGFVFKIAVPNEPARYLRMSGKVRIDEFGQFQGFRGIGLDISNERHAALNQQIFAGIFENSSEAIVIARANFEVLGTNPMFTDMCGYLPEEMEGQSLLRLRARLYPKGSIRKVAQALELAGVWQGEIRLRARDGQWLTLHLSALAVDLDYQKASRIVLIARDITQSKRQEHAIWHQAHFDHLTGLPNRKLFWQRLESAWQRCQSEKMQAALLFLDLDGFKQINDQHGHAAGDAVLVEVARRMQSLVRQADTVARWAGDEFTLLLMGLSQPEDAIRIADKLLLALQEPIQASGQALMVGASIGWVWMDQNTGLPEALIRRADRRMYAAKAAGKNCWVGEAEAMGRPGQAMQWPAPPADT